jgi:signal transduction histidine kinase
LDHALWGANSLSELVNTILDVSRAEAGLLIPNCQPVLPLSIVEAALTQVHYLGNQRRMNISLDIDPELPVFSADEGQLVRVLINLLGNAIRHAPEQGEILVSVQPDAEEDALLWCVSDNGPGIPTEDLERIFEKFEQIEGSNQSQFTSGLGLTLCRLVVEAHGGKIWVESQVEQGSSFYFRLPLEGSSSLTSS